MAKAITKKQEKKYVKGGGVRCPHCGSPEIEGGSFEADAGWVTQSVSCNDCEEEWTDQYSLEGIQESK